MPHKDLERRRAYQRDWQAKHRRACAERPYKEKPRCGRGLRLTVRHLKSPVSPSNPIHNADDCGKDYEGSGTEIVNASPAAVLN
jgi:hypothetical protein